MTTASQLIGEVSIKGASQAKSDLQSVGESTSATGGILKNVLGSALGLAIAGGAGAALGFLKDQMIDSVKVAMAHQTVMTQTAAAIKSTGDASGLSAGQIGDMATALSRTTDFSEDTVQSGENLLLTFTGIGKDVFPQTTQTMLDMATAMHTGPTQEAMLLGKALNDPTTGLSALTRVGVTFSTQEKQQIATMMSHNDIIGAQKVMLAELTKEFGGSAIAAGKTLSGAVDILKNNFDDLKEKVGSAVIPILSNFVGMINTTILPGLEKFGGILKTALLPVIDTLSKDAAPIIKTLTTDFQELFKSGAGGASFLSGLSGAFKEFAPLASRVGALMGTELLREFKDVGAAAQQVGTWFMSSVVPAVKAAMPGFESLGKVILTNVIPALIQIRGVIMDVVEHAFKTFGPIIEQVVPPLIRLAGILAGDVAAGLKFILPYVQQAAAELGKFADEIMDRIAPILKQWIADATTDIANFSKFWAVIWPSVSGVLQGVWNEIVGVVKIAWSIVSGIIEIGLDLLSGNWSGAWNDLKNMLGGVWGGIQQVISGGLQIINNLFGGLPGQLLTWGEDAIQGFINGIRNMIGGVASAVGDVASTISKALHFSKPEIGPLADADTWMPDMMTLLSRGLTDNLGQLKAASFGVAGAIAGGSGTGLHAAAANVLSGAGQGPTIVVQAGPVYLDGRLLASGLMPHIVNAIRVSTGTRV